MNDRLHELADRVDRLVEELDEIAFDLLRESAARHEPRPRDDARLMQARRALEKASRVLRVD